MGIFKTPITGFEISLIVYFYIYYILYDNKYSIHYKIMYLRIIYYVVNIIWFNFIFVFLPYDVCN